MQHQTIRPPKRAPGSGTCYRRCLYISAQVPTVAVHTRIMSAIVDVFLVLARNECPHLRSEHASFIVWFLLGSRTTCMLTRTCRAYVRLALVPCSMPFCQNVYRLHEVRALTMSWRVLRQDDNYWEASDSSSDSFPGSLCTVCVFQHNNRQCPACFTRYRSRPCPRTAQSYGSTVTASMHYADCQCSSCFLLVRAGFAYPAA
jgi:hypothetical protein